MGKRSCSKGILIPIGLILLSSLVNCSTGCCEKKERISSFLEAAVDLITKAKSENISCEGEHDVRGKVLDCADLYKRGHNRSGVYTIWPNTRLTSITALRVYCDMTEDGGGWTVIQRRGNFGRENDYFGKDWESYKKGFGKIEEDFWLGNDNIFALTNQRLYSVHFNIEDKQQTKRFARYDKFWIDDEYNNYTLHISGYTGTAGDAMQHHDKIKFSSKDRMNDVTTTKNCANEHNSGWWFKNCYIANLNGVYNGTYGIKWMEWKNEPLGNQAEIKIRPLIF